MYQIDCAYHPRNCSGSSALGALMPGLIFIAGASLGLLILDETSSAVPQFLPISAESAEKMGLSKNEHAAYLDELDELNSLTESIQNELERSNSLSTDDSVKNWNQVINLVSSDTQSALKKIFLYFVRK